MIKTGLQKDVYVLFMTAPGQCCSMQLNIGQPGPSGLSPEEIFTHQKTRPDRLLVFHTFGCRVFMLDPSLQQGHKIPKWKPRSRQAVYLGHSLHHAQTVPIVLNITIGICSLQYHVVFDDYFTSNVSRKMNILPSSWNDLFSHNCVNV